MPLSLVCKAVAAHMQVHMLLACWLVDATRHRKSAAADAEKAGALALPSNGHTSTAMRIIF